MFSTLVRHSPRTIQRLRPRLGFATTPNPSKQRFDGDVNYGKPRERPGADMNIERVGLPKLDPVDGARGRLIRLQAQHLVVRQIWQRDRESLSPWVFRPICTQRPLCQGGICLFGRIRLVTKSITIPVLAPILGAFVLWDLIRRSPRRRRSGYLLLPLAGWEVLLGP